MGFAMVVAPLSVLLLHGQQGVVFANLCGALAGLLLLWPVRQDIEWRRFGLLTLASAVGAFAGALIVGALDVAVFRIVVGLVLLLAIFSSLVAGRFQYSAPLMPSTLLTGGVTGLLVTMSGIGGPPMSIYAVITRWSHRAFAATMQPFVLVSSLIGAFAVLMASPGSLPALSAAMWTGVAIALIAGLAIGHVVNRFVSAPAGRAVVIVLGLIGAITAVTSGFSAL